jgi:hypothetical protein
MEAVQNGVDVLGIGAGLHGRFLPEPSVKGWNEKCAGKIRGFSDQIRNW